MSSMPAASSAPRMAFVFAGNASKLIGLLERSVFRRANAEIWTCKNDYQNPVGGRRLGFVGILLRIVVCPHNHSPANRAL
jgi:hypothetical protein